MKKEENKIKGAVKKIKYFIYCRKSSEDEDRQVQSIETQERELTELATKHNLEIAGIYRETKSAFKEGREVFNGMVADYKKGKADGLLVWQPSRISRNPIDGARIVDLIDTGHLKEIRSPSKIYSNSSSDKMMLAFELVFSKKDSDDKSTAVKDGLKTRAVNGLPSGKAYIGFLNDLSGERGNRGWKIDPERFPKINSLLHLFVKGNMSVQALHRYAMSELKLTTVPRKKSGGRPLCVSYLYTILKNPVYAGFFYYQDERRELDKSLPRLITEDQFWTIQDLLGRRGVPRPIKRESVYNHVMKCGECKGNTMADHKFQMICTNADCKKKFAYLNKTECPQCHLKIDDMVEPTRLHYIYYFCINQKKGITDCSHGMEVKTIENTIQKELVDHLPMSKELSDWCIETIQELPDEEIQTVKIERESREGEKMNIKKKLDALVDRILLTTDPDTLADYTAREAILRAELKEIEAKENSSVKDEDWLSKATKVFSLATDVKRIFESGTAKEKRDFMIEIGSNLILSDRKANVYNAEDVQLIIDMLKSAKAKNNQFEPEKIRVVNEQNPVFEDVNSSLLPVRDSNPNTILQRDVSYH